MHTPKTQREAMPRSNPQSHDCKQASYNEVYCLITDSKKLIYAQRGELRPPFFFLQQGAWQSTQF